MKVALGYIKPEPQTETKRPENNAKESAELTRQRSISVSASYKQVAKHRAVHDVPENVPLKVTHVPKSHRENQPVPKKFTFEEALKVKSNEPSLPKGAPELDNEDICKITFHNVLPCGQKTVPHHERQVKYNLTQMSSKHYQGQNTYKRVHMPHYTNLESRRHEQIANKVKNEGD